MSSYIYKLHFATPGIPSKIYISSLYRLSSNVLNGAPIAERVVLKGGHLSAMSLCNLHIPYKQGTKCQQVIIEDINK